MNRLYLLLFLAGAMGLSVEAAPPPEIMRCVALLADPSFPARQQAATDLRDFAVKRRAEVQLALTDAYRHSDDPEVRFRTREILTDLFVNSLGYIGMKFSKREHLSALGEKRWVIVVNEVLADSPASKAQLRLGDVILRLDGVALGANADIDFPQKVKSLGSGALVALSIEREGEEKRVAVTLGTWARPIGAAEADALFLSKIRSLETKPLR